YSGPERHYHNLAHVAAMLRDQDTFDPVARGPAVTLAILLHDVVYDAQRPDNEAESAALAERWLIELGLRSAFIDDVANLIRATDHRHDPEDLSAEARALIDLDLAILAAPDALYRAYAAGVANEYAHVPAHLFKEGRARVLTAFLARPRLYLTERAFNRWEPPARQNLRAEIERLLSST
ncbi:MAG: hypothetical protein RL291_1401, partial [Pseudomonadota bacterium]